MRIFLYIVIVIICIGCKSEPCSHDEALPVVASLTKLSYTCFEDTVYGKGDSSETMGQMYLEFMLTNPNEDSVWLPMNKVYIDSVYTDTLYRSHISVVLNGRKVYARKLYPTPLVMSGNEKCRMVMKIHDIDAKYLHDIKKTVTSLGFKYIKDKSDSISCKRGVGDIRFTVDSNIVLCKMPKIFWNNNIQSMPD